jgi:hypothetical protein
MLVTTFLDQWKNVCTIAVHTRTPIDCLLMKRTKFTYISISDYHSALVSIDILCNSSIVKSTLRYEKLTCGLLTSYIFVCITLRDKNIRNVI